VLVLSQVAVFVAIIAGVASAVRYLSQPRSADRLYAAITSRVDGDDDSSLGKVENEVNEFLERFPRDDRAEVLRTYKDTIQLDKLDRKLQRQTRGNSAVNPPLLPAEQQYLDAAALATTSPEKAISMLGSLIDLYDDGPSGSVKSIKPTAAANQKPDRDSADRAAKVVLLAKRRIQSLRAEVAKQREQQLADLNERLMTASQLKTSNPDRAAAIFQAIVNLHADDAWAADVVQKARDGIGELQKK
jgi:hypothetical protein